MDWPMSRWSGLTRFDVPHSELHTRGRRRNLEREIATVARKVATRKAEHREFSQLISPEEVREVPWPAAPLL